MNGTSSAELKPPGCKLLRCTVTLRDGVLVNIMFTGDFFIIPGEVIADLEKALIGLKVTDIEQAIHVFFSTVPVDMMGVAPEHFVKAAEMAIAAAS